MIWICAADMRMIEAHSHLASYSVTTSARIGLSRALDNSGDPNSFNLATGEFQREPLEMTYSSLGVVDAVGIEATTSV
jgi:hypothetical protein